MLAKTDLVSAGVNAYQTVLLTPPYPIPHDGVGSPASVLAADVFTGSLNGNVAIDVALTKASFDGGRIAWMFS